MTNKIDEGINHLIKHDKLLRTIIKKNSKCNLQPKRNYFNALVRSIVGQQLSVKAAASIYKRMLNYFENKPTAGSIAELSEETLRSFGLSRAKSQYIKLLSEDVVSGKIKLGGYGKMSNDEVAAELTEIKGIGLWSAHMFLMFTLGRLDILPIGDLGIRRAIMLNYNLEFLPDGETIKNIAIANKWNPYESIASWYLWKTLE